MKAMPLHLTHLSMKCSSMFYGVKHDTRECVFSRHGSLGSESYERRPGIVDLVSIYMLSHGTRPTILSRSSWTSRSSGMLLTSIIYDEAILPAPNTAQ